MIGSCAGSLYAIERSTGEPLWLYPTTADGASAQFHGELLVSGGALIVPTDAEPNSHLYAFDIDSGDVRWKISLPEGIASTPLLVRDQLVAVSATGIVLSIAPSTGTVAWRVSPAGSRASIPRLPSPAATTDRIFFADNSGKVFALNSADGSKLWQTDLGARVNTSLLVTGKSVLAGTADGLLHHISMKSGATEQKTRLKGMPYGTLVEASGVVLTLVKDDEAKLIAYDPTKREIRWEQPTRGEWTTYRPLVAHSTVIVGNDEKELCGFSMNDGSRQWCINVGEVPRGLGISSDGKLYVGTLSGKVFAYTRSVAAPVSGAKNP